MNISDILFLCEIVSPRKPEGVKSGIYSKSGVQGSISKVRTRDFTTSKGNKVKVLFDIQNDGEGKVVDINFYVNDTHYDDASTNSGKYNNDFEILSGVLYLAKSFVARGKYDKIKFVAQKGSGDHKVIRNLDIGKYEERYSQSLKRLLADIERFAPSEEQIELARNRAINMKAKFNKEVSSEVVEKDKLLLVINELLGSLRGISFEDFNRLDLAIKRLDRTIDSWDSYKEFYSASVKLREAFQSNTDMGFMSSRNRRASLYKKLVKKYFPDWDLDISGNYFELTRI